MNRRRILAGLLALGMLLPTAAWASGDEERRNFGPVLEQFQIGSDTAVRGGKLSIAADAWDDDGIRSIWARFIHDESGTLLSVPLELRFGDPRLEGRYSAELEIPENAPLGRYELRSVVLLDELDGRSRYFREADMRDGEDTDLLDDLLENEVSFQVVEDCTGPRLLGCSITEKSVRAGKDEEDRDYTFELTVTAADDAAGFQKGSFVFESESGGRLYAGINRNNYLYNGVDTDVYQKEIAVREHQTAGSYRLVKATLEDRAGNKTVLGYGKDSLPLDTAFVCGVQVVSEESGQSQPPILQSVAIGDKRHYIQSDTHRTDYEIIVGARGQGSEIHHITVKFKNRQTGATVSKVIRAQGQEHSLGDDIYTGWLTLGSWEQPGTFTLDSVVVTDKAGNRRTYRRPEDVSGSQVPLPCTASFTAAEGASREDTQPPVVTGLEMDSVTPEGIAIPLRAQVSDDLSGVDTLRARFENKEGRVITISLHPGQDGWWSGKVPGSRIKKWDQYNLIRLTATDNAGNRRVYQQKAGVRGEALPRQITFTVQDYDD